MSCSATSFSQAAGPVGPAWNSSGGGNHYSYHGGKLNSLPVSSGNDQFLSPPIGSLLSGGRTRRNTKKMHGSKRKTHGGKRKTHGSKRKTHGGKRKTHGGKRKTHGGKRKTRGGKRKTHGGKRTAHRRKTHVGKRRLKGGSRSRLLQPLTNLYRQAEFTGSDFVNQWQGKASPLNPNPVVQNPFPNEDIHLNSIPNLSNIHDSAGQAVANI